MDFSNDNRPAFRCVFLVKSEKFPYRNGDYIVSYDHETNEATIFRSPFEKRITQVDEDFRKDAQKMKPEEIEILDFESERKDTFIESWDFGTPYYNYARGHADYQDNWQDVEIDTITREWYHKFSETWEQGDESRDEAIKRFFGFGYAETPRQFED